ncbi:MAG TPA: hypothetical protein VMY37_33500 [Thermoguttaceae bacterium]|nr:hypothetical protein [Thermoguttaceae bacterium]
MDPFRLCLALGPVAIYLLLIGAINMFRRPFLVSGTRDAAALGLAVSGLVIVGPVELFFPVNASLRFGGFVWVLLAALYALSLVLVLLLLRPRLVVYNISRDELRPILTDLVAELDREARWAGDSLVLPNLGIQLHMDGLAAMRNVSLTAIGAIQNHQSWRRLELALGAALSQVEVARNPHALGLLSAGALLMLAVILAIAQDPQAVAQSLFEMLRL